MMPILKRQCSHDIDLSKIAARESYQLDMLHRFGGKTQFRSIIATFCDHLKEHPKLESHFEAYNLKELNNCVTGILNAAFRQLPESVDLDHYFLNVYVTAS